MNTIRGEYAIQPCVGKKNSVLVEDFIKNTGCILMELHDVTREEAKVQLNNVLHAIARAPEDMQEWEKDLKRFYPTGLTCLGDCPDNDRDHLEGLKELVLELLAKEKDASYQQGKDDAKAEQKESERFNQDFAVHDATSKVH